MATTAHATGGKKRTHRQLQRGKEAAGGRETGEGGADGCCVSWRLLRDEEEGSAVAAGERGGTGDAAGGGRRVRRWLLGPAVTVGGEERFGGGCKWRREGRRLWVLLFFFVFLLGLRNLELWQRKGIIENMIIAKLNLIFFTILPPRV